MHCTFVFEPKPIKLNCIKKNLREKKQKLAFIIGQTPLHI